MRIAMLGVVGAMVVGQAMSAVAAGTAREALQKKLTSVAPPLDAAKGKVLCYCSDTQSITLDRVGFVRQSVVNNQVSVTCAIDTFDAGGAKINELTCPVFTPLVK